MGAVTDGEARSPPPWPAPPSPSASPAFPEPPRPPPGAPRPPRSDPSERWPFPGRLGRVLRASPRTPCSPWNSRPDPGPGPGGGVLGGWSRGREHTWGARERWQGCVGGWYQEGVQAVGGCGEGAFGENMGSEQWRRGGKGGDPAAPGSRRARGGAGRCENLRSRAKAGQREQFQGCQRTEGDTWRGLLDRLRRPPDNGVDGSEA